MRKTSTGSIPVRGAKTAKSTSSATSQKTSTSSNTSLQSNQSNLKKPSTVKSSGASDSQNRLSPRNTSPRHSRSPSPSSATNSKPIRATASSSIKDAIAQARLKKATNKTSTTKEEEQEVGSKSLNVIVKQAKSSGRINISHRSLKAIPEEVWRMYEVDPKSITIDFSGGGSDVWYETVDLVRMVAADNQLEVIDKRIAEFNALVFIDLHNNNLSSLPKEFGELQNLTTLNLSINRFSELPDCLTTLSSLVELQLSSNKLTGVLDSSFGNLSRLEILDISSNEITGLPKEIENLKNLRKLNLAKNKLKEIPGLAISGMKNLEELEISENKLEIIFTGLDGQTVELHSLKRLDIRQNRLKTLDESTNATIFHPTIKLPKLKEFLASLNLFETFGPLLHTTPDLEILDIGDNKFHELPEGLLTLKSLKRLDLSNNDLKVLPAELGMLTALDFLGFDGNPIRNAPKGPKSTAAVLKSLRDRLTTVDFENMDEPTIPERTTNHARTSNDADVKKTSALGTVSQQNISSKTLDLSKKSLTTVSEEDLQEITFEPSTVLLGFNLLQTIPISFKLFSTNITCFQLDHNKFTTFPTFEDKSIVFPNVSRLDLSANQITSIPDDSQQTPFPNLQVLNVNNCRIESLPTKFSFPKLTTFLATSNLLTSITPSTFENMEVVDISNNNINFLPPLLGDITTIKTLLVEGNSFRVPRYTIVQQGTTAIMEYLRGRIPR
ncbi:L domain-like protein [Gigaspora margarita]|uniref:L domain-like protein n=1 Tax=Gigaspora margarita TaxID=4874 RepID=A0A8H4A2I1_GIGMA|nr:L domain-like protein [Gigaspora margarita]